MGWTNALVIREPVYQNLVRLFYSNMLISTHIAIRVVTNVCRISIEFDVEDLNMILKTTNKELDIYTSRQRIDYPCYYVVNAVMNICRRSDLSSQFCKSTLKSQALPLQLQVLHSLLQHVISSRLRHGNEVTHLDVALLDSICSLIYIINYYQC